MRTPLLLLSLTAVLLLSLPVYAQNPKREMRATYLTSVNNIDWPSAKGLTQSMQKQELLRLLDSIESLNLNTVLFQIRPNADALYKSQYEPWSDVLTGTRGKDPGYDPLQLCIDECHKRGMQCHAWMNPYRYSRTGARWTGAHDNPLNYENSHPDWLLYYSSNIVLDPGLPEVLTRVKEVVGDVVNNYDIDGIIFDDYFYPYGGTTNQDAQTVAKYKPENMSVGDWRRDNVRRMVQAVYDTIQAVKPWVTFGISPFGIWTTDTYVARKEGITLPYGISGGNMYEEIYCDPVAWLKDGTIDYISPQLYWAIGTGQDYKKLCKWWADLANQFGVHFYSSMAIYRYNEKSEVNKAFTITELQNEENLNRSSSTDNAFGFFFYNTKAWVYDRTFRNAFYANQLKYKSLPPAINWKQAEEQPMVTDMEVEGKTLRWKHANADKVHFSVYAIPNSFKNTPHLWSLGDALLGVTYTTEFTLPDNIGANAYTICVGVLDAYGNEYAMRILGQDLEEAQPATLLTPLNNQGYENWDDVVFTWQEVKKADSYILQIATDPDFQQLLVVQELTANSFTASNRLNLGYKGMGTYYWRVKTRKPNTGDIWSAPRTLIIGEDIDPTGLQQLTNQNEEHDLRKIIENGQVYILRDGVRYNMLGTRISSDK